MKLNKYIFVNYIAFAILIHWLKIFIYIVKFDICIVAKSLVPSLDTFS